MASAFTFGFGGDDILDEDTVDMEHDLATIKSDKKESAVKLQSAEGEQSGLVFQEAMKHDLDDMIALLPSQIAYNNTLSINDPNGSKAPFFIPRREMFDIRAQLMAEDDTETNETNELISGLEEGDIKPSVYEGGFKTWECAIDLARLVSSEYSPFILSEAAEGKEEELHVIELGAGTAIPSLALLRSCLSKPAPARAAGIRQRKIHFLFADYNDTVLNLVTLPNIILTWYAACGDDRFGSESELEIDSTLCESFRQDLSARGIQLSFISGAWSPKFIDLAMSHHHQQLKSGDNQPYERKTLILASETIYSPSCLRPFSETLVSLLRRASDSSSASNEPSVRGQEDKVTAKAFIAAKKVYFGVGGGVDEFLMMLRDIVGDGVVVNEKADIKDEGVGRTTLEVQLKN